MPFIISIKGRIQVSVVLTCRFGPGEDKASSATAPHLLIAGMDVNTVDSEGPQVGDL